MEFDFTTDEATKELLEKAVLYLQKEFNHEENRAIDLMNRFYNMRKDHLEAVGWGDYFYHHEGARHTAWMVHYFVGLEKDWSYQDFVKWQFANGYNGPSSNNDQKTRPSNFLKRITDSLRSLFNRSQ